MDMLMRTWAQVKPAPSISAMSGCCYDVRKARSASSGLPLAQDDDVRGRT
jgi:hypothetical protein